MQHLNIPFEIAYPPKLDPDFIPFGIWSAQYRKAAWHPVSIALERPDGQIAVRHTVIYNTKAMQEADCCYLERYVKFLLWSVGGFRVTICGCDAITEKIAQAYTPTGTRAFDFDFFQKLYERPLEICASNQCPLPNETPCSIGGHLEGCRIGFDAGGSDRKVSAVIDGKCVYSVRNG